MRYSPPPAFAHWSSTRDLSKNVPGRKTDVGDTQWLATLARGGLLRGSFIAPVVMRELRLTSHQRQNLSKQLSSAEAPYLRSRRVRPW